MSLQIVASGIRQLTGIGNRHFDGDLGEGKTYQLVKQTKNNDIKIIRYWADKTSLLEKLKEDSRNMTIRVYSKKSGEIKKEYKLEVIKPNYVTDKGELLKSLQLSNRPITIYIYEENKQSIEFYCVNASKKKSTPKQVNDYVRTQGSLNKIFT
jgi:hypothetical protein